MGPFKTLSELHRQYEKYLKNHKDAMPFFDEKRMQHRDVRVHDFFGGRYLLISECQSQLKHQQETHRVWSIWACANSGMLYRVPLYSLDTEAEARNAATYLMNVGPIHSFEQLEKENPRWFAAAKKIGMKFDPERKIYGGRFFLCHYRIALNADNYTIRAWMSQETIVVCEGMYRTWGMARTAVREMTKDVYIEGTEEKENHI